MKYILAIDLGTSGHKVALVTTQGHPECVVAPLSPDCHSLRQRLIGYHRGTALFCPNWVPRPRKVGQR